MKKLLGVLAMAAVSLASVWALGVDEPELQSTGADGIQFENYGGPHVVIETAAAITNIGTELGRVVASDVEKAVIVKPEGKYTLIHAVDSSTKEKLDADILVLNPNAGVDHIRNLRRIITGFLEAAYSYEREDAETIATFVTIYNAVYRGNLSNFSGKYKDAVLQNLSEEKVGLSTIWSEWPGNTQIVIPLNDPQGGISSVDTTTITDKQVVEALRQEEDKGIAARENMAEIKEREAVTATQKAQEAQRTAAEERKAAAVAPTREEKAAATERAEKAAEAATDQQHLADRKNVEVKTERQEIAIDQGKAVPEVDRSNYLTGLFGADDRSGFYRLLTVDGNTGEVVLSSPVTQIRGKTVFTVADVNIAQEDGVSAVYPSLFVAVCGTNDGHSAVKLCLIDSVSLEILKQSDETLADTTELLRNNDSFYVLVKLDGACYVGMYDKNLSLVRRSSVAVKPTTPLNVVPKGLLVTAADGSPLLLDMRSLEGLW